MKIAIASDHAGFAYKERIKSLLIQLGHEVRDFGTDSNAPVDYPTFIRPAAEAVASGNCERGIVLGGSGNGEAMVANKVSGVRCAVLESRYRPLGARTQRRQRAGHWRTNHRPGTGLGDRSYLAGNQVCIRPPRY